MGDFLQPYSADVIVEKTDGRADPRLRVCRVTTVDKLGGWNDECAGRMVEKTNHSVWTTKGGSEVT